MHQAMLSTTVFVAKKLLNYQVLLLLAVHDFFPQQVRDIIHAFMHPIDLYTPLYKKMLICNLFVHQKILLFIQQLMQAR